MSKKKTAPEKKETATRNLTLNLQDIIRNDVILRSTFLKRWLDPRRDMDTECGYPQEIRIEDYKKAFERGDLASRVVMLYPEETWCSSPEVLENDDEDLTEFEQEFIQLDATMNIFSYLERVDILSGIGQFGVLLLGISDGKNLDQPVAGLNDKGELDADAAPSEDMELLYLRAFDQQAVKVKKVETRQSSPRYGLPVLYEITFVNLADGIIDGTTEELSKQEVHWHRLLHVADNRVSSEIYGIPRMKKVFNRLLDLGKIAGSAGEMFWKGGFPGLSLESAVDPEKAAVDLDVESTQEQMEAYMNGLQRYIATVGMQVKNLGTQVADPRPHVEAQVRLIAVAMSVPWRILMGVEVGHLAAEQDIRAWNRRLDRRRTAYVNPFILVPFINRMVAFGILPKPEALHIVWPDLNTLSDADKATVAEKKTNSLIKYVQGGVHLLVPEFFYLTLILGISDAQAKQVIEAAGGNLKKLDDLIMAGPGKGNQPGQSATKGAMQPPRRSLSRNEIQT